MTGAGGSANGASSFHLWWELDPPAPLVQVAATLEVLEAPSVPRLYFWALQASFAAGRRSAGGGHLGLQWAGGDPPLRSVNWGGYRAAGDGGGELGGTASALPSRRHDPNTRDYAWAVGRPYRLRIRRSSDGPGLWRGDVTDLVSGSTTVVRDLRCPGRHLVEPVVWSEVFARCDDPSVTVRWSGLEGVTATGRRVAATAVVTSYQPHDRGGCDNTTAAVDGAGWLQRTNTRRHVPPGSRLSLPR